MTVASRSIPAAVRVHNVDIGGVGIVQTVNNIDVKTAHFRFEITNQYWAYRKFPIYKILIPGTADADDVIHPNRIIAHHLPQPFTGYCSVFGAFFVLIPERSKTVNQIKLRNQRPRITHTTKPPFKSCRPTSRLVKLPDGGRIMCRISVP